MRFEFFWDFFLLLNFLFFPIRLKELDDKVKNKEENPIGR